MQSLCFCPRAWLLLAVPGDFDLNGWVQNCLQLSGCFLDCNAFALSKHCCAAVEALLLREHKQQQQQQQQQQPSQQQASCDCDTPSSDTQCKDTAEQQQQQAHGPGKDQAEKPVVQLKGAASKPQPEQDDNGSCGLSAPLVAALALLDKDVAANVCLAFAKLHLYCLVASHEYIVEGKQVAFAYSSVAEVPSVLCFDALPGLPALASLPWGPAAVARDAEGALQLFKAALPWFKRALQYYQLDGWVTEHCNIVFEMSNLYRCGVLKGVEVMGDSRWLGPYLHCIASVHVMHLPHLLLDFSVLTGLKMQSGWQADGGPGFSLLCHSVEGHWHCVHATCYALIVLLLQVPGWV